MTNTSTRSTQTTSSRNFVSVFASYDPFADEVLSSYPEFIVPSGDHLVSHDTVMAAIIGPIKKLFRSNKGAEDADAYAALEKHAEFDVEALNRQSEDAASSSDAETLRGDSPSESTPGFKVDARFISDAIIGLSDGLTVPFALTAGLSGLGDTKVVILGGFAELIAGAISMGLGGYLAAKSEEESYRSLEATTRTNIKVDPTSVESDIASVFESYNVPEQTVKELTTHMSSSPLLADFLLRFKHEQAEPPASRALICAITIALGYFIGGLIPLLPYFFVQDVMTALWGSVAAMCFALFVFGYSKTCYNCGWKGRSHVWEGTKGGVQMMIIGCVAAGCAMVLVRAFKHLAD